MGGLFEMAPADTKGYAEAKGGRVARLPNIAPEGRRATPAKPLPDHEIERISEVRAEVHRYLPELVPFINELYELGMVDGWRCVKNVTVFAEKGVDER